MAHNMSFFCRGKESDVLLAQQVRSVGDDDVFYPQVSKCRI